MIVKLIYQRILALLFMCIPGGFAIYGWTWMRDILFDYFAGRPFAWLPFIAALSLFLFGLAILGGFIFHHDKKRGRLLEKKPAPHEE